jgi:hypothetical protein
MAGLRFPDQTPPVNALNPRHRPDIDGVPVAATATSDGRAASSRAEMDANVDLSADSRSARTSTIQDVYHMETPTMWRPPQC